MNRYKEKDSGTIEQYRTISLLNVEGKIFMLVLAKRLSEYIVKNNYINTSIQKAGIQEFSSCLEHTSVLSQLLKEARSGKKDLTVVASDLANSYGTVPHKLIKAAMDTYHIPERVKEITSVEFRLDLQLESSLQHGNNLRRE